MGDDPTSATHDEAAAALGQRLTGQLLALMEDRGISRSELARRLGTSPAYVTKILRGDANFTLTSLIKLAEALEVELEIGLRAAAGRDAVRPARVPRTAASQEPDAPPPAPTRPPAGVAEPRPPRRGTPPVSGGGDEGDDWRVW